MPLDTECTIPHYLIGRAFAVAEKQTGKSVPDTILNLCLTRPLSGLAMFASSIAVHLTRDSLLCEILSAMPIEISDGPTSVEDQGPFWIGYYHQRAAMSGRTA